MILTMKYSRYKSAYSDCKTVPGTYNRWLKTIDVDIPEGRMKPSGTRGQRYRYMWFNGKDLKTGNPVRICIKAVSVQNAVKRLPKEYPTCQFDLSFLEQFPANVSEGK